MADDLANTIELYVFGIKTIVSEPITARGHLDSTWYEFLNNVCGIQVGPDDAVKMYTTSFSATSKRGWSAELSEKIRVFVEKFALKRDKYSVRIGQIIPGYDNNDQADANRHSNETPGTSSSNSKRNFIEVEPTPQTNRRKSFKTSSTSSPIRNRVHRNGVEVINVEEDESLGTNEPVESVHGRNLNSSARASQNGSRRSSTSSQRTDDLKPVVKDRIKRFSNAYYLRVLQEFKVLQRNRLWDRNVQHAPLSSYLIQELFSD